MENSIYTVDYFINKFESIPADQIGTREIKNQCALYHCGLRSFNINPTEEAKALIKLFGGEHSCSFSAVWIVNDGWIGNEDLTAKQRILEKLYDIKAAQHPAPKAPEVVERVVYKTVVIDEAVKNLQETLNEN